MRSGEICTLSSCNLRARNPNITLTPDFTSLREDSVVPPGLESFFPLFPALSRWAKLDRPCRGWIFAEFVLPIIAKEVLTHKLVSPRVGLGGVAFVLELHHEK